MRKILITSVLICGFCLSQAQVINIPDPAFKNYLLNNTLPQIVDRNGDGEIQVSEAEAITSLIINQDTPDSIRDFTGIRAFSNLTNLWMTDLATTSCDLSNLTQLKSLYINDQKSLDSLNTNGCVNLLIIENRKV